MKSIVLVDYDKTLTSKDTTKSLIFSLLKKRYFLIYKLFIFYLKTKVFKSSDIQLIKNRLIGELIKDRKVDEVRRSLVSHKKYASTCLRKEILRQLQNYMDDGKIVMIVTASPSFAVSYCVKEYPFIVVGTDFEVNFGVHGSETIGPICYGNGKVEKISSWVNLNIEDQYEYFESWSDEISDFPMLNLSKRQVIVCNKNDEKRFAGYFDSPIFFNPI